MDRERLAVDLGQVILARLGETSRRRLRTHRADARTCSTCSLVEPIALDRIPNLVKPSPEHAAVGLSKLPLMFSLTHRI